jgi:hypothetical protein
MSMWKRGCRVCGGLSRVARMRGRLRRGGREDEKSTMQDALWLMRRWGVYHTRIHAYSNRYTTAAGCHHGAQVIDEPTAATVYDYRNPNSHRACILGISSPSLTLSTRPSNLPRSTGVPSSRSAFSSIASATSWSNPPKRTTVVESQLTIPIKEFPHERA